MQEIKGYRSVRLTKEAANKSERLVSGMVSTIDPDLIGDVMIPDGCDFGRMSKSVTVHHDDTQVIGSHRNKAIKSNGVWVQFKVGNWPAADVVWDMIQDEALGAMSIEFVGVDYGPPTGPELKQYGKAASRVYRKWVMLKYSLVAQPCNPGAVIDSKALVHDWLERRLRAGKVTTETAKSLGWKDNASPTRLVLMPNGWVLRATA